MGISVLNRLFQFPFILLWIKCQTSTSILDLLHSTEGQCGDAMCLLELLVVHGRAFKCLLMSLKENKREGGKMGKNKGSKYEPFGLWPPRPIGLTSKRHQTKRERNLGDYAIHPFWPRDPHHLSSECSRSHHDHYLSPLVLAPPDPIGETMRLSNDNSHLRLYMHIFFKCGRKLE